MRLILIQIINITASISIHAPHEGVRLDVILSDFLGKNFNPRTPRGGATESLEETHEETAISIHAPHEGVRRINLSSPSRNGISIHAPHEGVRRLRRACSPARQIFQSTHPTRGCDLLLERSRGHTAHFNPRTPRGGATVAKSPLMLPVSNFNPRTPRGGATSRGGGHGQPTNISIHAPHEGVRHGFWDVPDCKFRFQSTHPTRGCDLLESAPGLLACISIHAPHEGVRRFSAYFNDVTNAISIHAPHEGVRRIKTT